MSIMIVIASGDAFKKITGVALIFFLLGNNYGFVQSPEVRKVVVTVVSNQRTILQETNIYL